MEKYQARQIIEQLCQSGPDPFGMLSSQLNHHTSLLAEAWNQQTFDKIVGQIKASGQDLIDHVVTDDYDLALVKIPKVDGITGPVYAVMMGSEQHNPMDPATQRAKFPGSSLRHLSRNNLANILHGWIEEYGRLFIGSVDKRKYDLYKRVLGRYFKIESSLPGYPFFISNKSAADVKQESGLDCVTASALQTIPWDLKLRCLLEDQNGVVLQSHSDYAVVKWAGGKLEHVDYDDEIRLKTIGVL